jgi:hypothetical protein
MINNNICIEYMERYFFDTFGYITYDCEYGKEIVEEYETDLCNDLCLPSINIGVPKLGEHGRGNIRFDNLKSDKIYSVFYNENFLDEIYKIVDDFVVLSPMESFILQHSEIHRDLASETKNIKVLFYLDDVSSVEKGPLYVFPGTQNIYDKYSISMGKSVGWPNPGARFNQYSEYLNANAPKKYIFSNLNKLIVFNHNMFHGSDGNIEDPAILRRCIGMTLVCVDRSNEILMKKVNNLFKSYKVDNKTSLAYEYCKKNNLDRWLNHFYIPSYDENIEPCENVLHPPRWEHYLNYFETSSVKNMDNIFNCFNTQVSAINSIDSSISFDFKGL